MPYVSPVLEHDLQTQSVGVRDWVPATCHCRRVRTPGRMSEGACAEQVGVTGWWEAAGTA